MVKPKTTTSPGRIESITALLIVSALICIAVIIYYVHLDFNPSVKLVVAQSSSVQTNLHAATKDSESILKLPDGIGVLSAAEIFQAHDLADKINGKAEFYLSAGFSELNCQRFASYRDPDLWAEVYIYRMANADAAFAVYSGQRREGVETLPLSRHAYLAENAVFLAKGAIYAEIIAPVVTPESRKVLLALAAGVTELVSDTETGSNGASLFPPKQLSPDSIQLLAADVFGFQQLNSVYTASYGGHDSALVAFVSPRSSPEEARALALAYGNFLIQFGGQPAPEPHDFEAGQIIEIMDTYEVIFTSGVYFAGVHEAENRTVAEELAHRLMRHLAKVTDGS